MRTYRITITMADGSQGVTSGLYADGFDAVLQTLENFPQAIRISAVRLNCGGATP